MRKSLWLGGLVAVAVAGSAYAQEDPKTVFQGRYDSFRAAMAAKDEAAAKAVVAPGYQMTDIQGGTHDASSIARMMDRLPSAMAQAAKTRVIEAAITGDSAAVKQELAATIQRPGPDGKEMTLEMALVSDDVWIKVGDAWLLKTSVQKELTVKRDGDVVLKQSK